MPSIPCRRLKAYTVLDGLLSQQNNGNAGRLTVLCARHASATPPSAWCAPVELSPCRTCAVHIKGLKKCISFNSNGCGCQKVVQQIAAFPNVIATAEHT